MPEAVPEADDAQNLQPLGLAGMATHLKLASPGAKGGEAPTSVSLFDQGLTQYLEAAVTGLEPKQPYVLALASRADGSGVLEPLSSFMTNPTGSAIVNAVGPIRQVVQGGGDGPHRYLVVAPGSPMQPGRPVQVQVE